MVSSKAQGRKGDQGKAAAKSPDVKRPALKREGAKHIAGQLAVGAAGGKGSRQAAVAAVVAGAAVPLPAAAAPGGSEIDELFGKLKGKGKAAAAAADEPAAAAVREAKGAAKGKEKGKRVEGSKDDIFGTEAASLRKRTEEGYAIYSETELGLGRSGGNTDQCPFDCDCCF